ncbi:unnamed protein product [Cochlearia groenlandica]
MSLAGVPYDGVTHGFPRQSHAPPHGYCFQLEEGLKAGGRQGEAFYDGWRGLAGSCRLLDQPHSLVVAGGCYIACMTPINGEGSGPSLQSKRTVLSESQTPHNTSQDHAEKNAHLRRHIEEKDQRYANITNFFSIIAMESPNLARMMQARGITPTQPPVIPPEKADATIHELGRDMEIEDLI